MDNKEESLQDLMKAIKDGDYWKCKYLLESGVCVDTTAPVHTDIFIDNPLLLACYYHRDDIIKLIISSHHSILTNEFLEQFNDSFVKTYQTAFYFRLSDEDLIRNEIARRKKETSFLLAYSRICDEESLFSEDNLPLDLFKVLLITSEIYYYDCSHRKNFLFEK